MSRSPEQAAINESAFRRANEKLEETAAEFGHADERTPYLCECEDERCTKVVLLTRAEYEEVRAEPKRFLVLPGHQEADDLVVQQEAEFIVIEKSGEEGLLVAQQDPRLPGANRSTRPHIGRPDRGRPDRPLHGRTLDEL